MICLCGGKYRVLDTNLERSLLKQLKRWSAQAYIFKGVALP